MYTVVVLAQEKGPFTRAAVEAKGHAPNLPTNMVGFRGFDSNIILM